MWMVRRLAIVTSSVSLSLPLFLFFSPSVCGKWSMLIMVIKEEEKSERYTDESREGEEKLGDSGWRESKVFHRQRVGGGGGGIEVSHQNNITPHIQVVRLHHDPLRT